MSFEHTISVISALMSFAGLMFVAVQMRIANRQRESDSLSKIYDNNRQLLTLGFSHAKLFEVLEDAKGIDPRTERHYVQLWLNQFAQIHSYLERAIFKHDVQQSFERDLLDFLSMHNVQRFWLASRQFYPLAFQAYVNGMLEKLEPPEAAQVSPS